MAKSNPVESSRIVRILTYMVAASIGLSLVCFFAVIIGTATGADIGSGVWLTVAWIPMIGLPIGFILIIVVLMLTFLRRAREAKDAGN